MWICYYMMYKWEKGCYICGFLCFDVIVRVVGVRIFGVGWMRVIIDFIEFVYLLVVNCIYSGLFCMCFFCIWC